jgi:hypothetical protein
MTRIGTVPIELLDGQTYEQPFQVMTSDKSANKVEFLLFKIDTDKAERVPPESVTGADRIKSAYRNVYLWIAVH